MICYERKNKITKEKRFNNAPGEFRDFLLKFYVEDKNGFVFSSDIEREFREYLWVVKGFSARWITPRIEMVFHGVKKGVQDAMVDGEIKRRRGFKGFRLKDKEDIEKVLDLDWKDSLKVHSKKYYEDKEKNQRAN